MLKASELKDQITFQARAVVQEERFGTKTGGSWGGDITVWAKILDVLPSQAMGVEDNVVMARRPVHIRIRWRTDITDAMRILYGNRILKIVKGPADIGHRDGLEIVAEEYSTAGKVP